ncbi:putative fad binding domain protein [Daldinia childiae]|uniref:putative fad binding domain protein n=1 Tax=Daldinia childiae TaxID=326645 RepID=UPI001444BD5D|nr:putative fad binding domain protein [Daldinia childiae]KAF3054898.1 putative fad binding domain protein [Daldinia childiae]
MASAGTRLRRAVVSVPFLFIAAFCLHIMDPSTIVAFQQPFADSGVIEWDGGKIPIIDNFHGIYFLDNIFRGGMATFSASTFGYDPVAWWQIFSFLTDLGPVYAIWILESYRVGYAYTPAYL